ncbi:MAG: MarR family transcriptional regulator [Chitinophagales bacterium]|nr:MarR family transcriptional regulator [Chitinophagales bacterium]
MTPNQLPVARLLWRNAHLYLGALNSKLDQLDIERYFSALIMIENEYPRSSQQEIADQLGVDKAAMVRILNYLTSHGYVIRESDKNDKRKHRIRLTEKAARRMKEIHGAVKELNEYCSSQVSKGDWGIFMNVLQQMYLNLKALPSRDLIINVRRKKVSKINSKQYS